MENGPKFTLRTDPEPGKTGKFGFKYVALMSKRLIMAMDANRERAPRKVQGLVMACDRSRDLVAVVARTCRWDWPTNSGRTKCDAIRFYVWNDAVRSGGSEMSLLDGT